MFVVDHNVPRWLCDLKQHGHPRQHWPRCQYRPSVRGVPTGQWPQITAAPGTVSARPARRHLSNCTSLPISGHTPVCAGPFNISQQDAKGGSRRVGLTVSRGHPRFVSLSPHTAVWEFATSDATPSHRSSRPRDASNPEHVVALSGTSSNIQVLTAECLRRRVVGVCYDLGVGRTCRPTGLLRSSGHGRMTVRPSTMGSLPPLPCHSLNRERSVELDAWRRMQSWELVLPPSRPSQEHLDWFEEQLVDLEPDAPVAVLGSTPELRDLLARLGFKNIYILERNLEFYNKVNQLRTRGNSENLIKGNWMQSLPTCRGMFSAILSDLTAGNIPYSLRQEFYRLITEALQPRGIFCDKFLSHPIPHENLGQLLKKYERAPLNLYTVNRFNCEVLFCSELLSRFNGVDTTQSFQFLNEMNLGPMNRKIMEELPKITPAGMTWDYGKPWNEVRRAFDPRLDCTVDRLEKGNSPYANRLRCLRWDKRGDN